MVPHSVRKVPCGTGKDLLEVFNEALPFYRWLLQWRVKLALQSPAGSLTLEHKKPEPSFFPTLHALLDATAQELEKDAAFEGLAPVFAFDEANKLKWLARKASSDEDKTTLTLLLDWCVAMTKQKAKLHIIMASSDAFYVRWLSKQVGKGNLKSVVIGDLPRAETEKFYANEIQERKVQGPLPAFKDVYDLFGKALPHAIGGRMFDISRFLEAVRDGATLEHNPIALDQRATLADALTTPKGSLLYPDYDHPTNWNRASATALFKSIAEAGYCELETLPDELKVAALSLMEHNVLHYRPRRPLVEDIVGKLVCILCMPE